MENHERSTQGKRSVEKQTQWNNAKELLLTQEGAWQNTEEGNLNKGEPFCQCGK